MSYDCFLKEASGLLEINWRKYRRQGARKRALAYREQRGLDDWESLLGTLRAKPEAARAFPDRMRVTVSRFLRERARWEKLMDRVFPQLWDGLRHFRVWSAGCCSGEEPYTLALLWRERYGKEGLAHLEILATDLDETVLARAAEGVYGPGSVRELPSAFLARYFTKQKGGWRIGAAPRRPVQFARHNLMDPPPLEGADLLLCRYLPFTYYRGERQRHAAHRLHQALRPGGALMIGRKEGLGPEAQTLFTPWEGAPGVFRRIG